MDREDMNLTASDGIAVRKFRQQKGHGYVDYLLFVDSNALGVVEAKPAGYSFTSVEFQAKKYVEGLPTSLTAPVKPLPPTSLAVASRVRCCRWSGDLRALLRAQEARREALTTKGIIVPWVVFWMVAKGRGGKKRPMPVLGFTKAFKAACTAAGCPGRIPTTSAERLSGISYGPEFPSAWR